MSYENTSPLSQFNGFNEHRSLRGLHSFLSPSQYHWVNYTDVKLIETYENKEAAARGVTLHNLASELIELNIKVTNNNLTFNRYVNDAIGYKMAPEVMLYYSDNCFGTADAISFRRNKLRIHDLKTGVTPANITQLIVYAAIFCLEYRQDPNSIEIELRIYQNDEITILEPEPIDILTVMEKIVHFDKLIDRYNEESQ